MLVPTGIARDQPLSPLTTAPSLHLTNDTPTCRNPHISDPEYAHSYSLTCTEAHARACTHRSWDCSCHEEILIACPIAAISAVDVNQTVKIESATLSVNGKTRVVNWDEARHDDCTDCEGKIMSIEAEVKGKVMVKLGTGKVIKFENPASKSNELLSALTSADVNQAVRIKSTTLSVNGRTRAVKWRNGWLEAEHTQCKDWEEGKVCEGTIMSVDPKFKGRVEVKLRAGNVIQFDNPASRNDERPFDTACYRSKLCHSPKVCQSWKHAVCTGVASCSLPIVSNVS